ncbi:acyltransferase family protein, partial [Raoultella planticola]|uniref:acyltransferase family protein n=1 Tax=Raoultella planticola TaxID=575 RepID=UPI0034D2D96D
AAEPASPAGRAAGPAILRAAAVLLVMAWHLPKAARAGPLAMLQPYGWLGVDVFFVLSGYLIGRQLLAAAARDGGIDLPDFY